MFTAIIGTVIIIGSGIALAGSCLSAEAYLNNQEICRSEFTVFNN